MTAMGIDEVDQELVQNIDLLNQKHSIVSRERIFEWRTGKIIGDSVLNIQT